MSPDIGQFANGNGILTMVGVPDSVGDSVVAVSVAALVKQPLREIQILLLAGRHIELDQREFYLLVARHPMALPGTEYAHHMVCHTDAHIQELPLPGHVVICHSGLYHMAGAVHFVIVHIGPAPVQPRQDIICVDISILHLGGGELVYPLVALGLQDRIGIIPERICHTFQRLVNVGIVEEYS